jgi:cAMP-dependent protein kinase regulator
VLCPFTLSDLGKLVDLLAPKGEGRRHAWSYLQRRVFRRLGTTRSFKGEGFYIMVSLTMVAWVYLGFHFATLVVRSVLHTIACLPLRETVPIDQVLVFGVLVLAGLVAMVGILALLAGIARAVIKNVPERAGRPSEAASEREPVRDLLKNCPLFAHLDDEALGELAGQAKKLGYRAGQLIIRQGDEGDSFFVIEKGNVAVLVTEDSGLEWTVAFLGPGDAFGEMALLQYGQRTATVRAESDLILVAIDREHFLYALGDGSVPLSKVTALLRATQTMRGSAVFNAMSPGALARVVGLARRETCKEGDVIIQEGESGDSFYIIESGAASVTRAGASDPVARLGPGDFFGEIALLSDAPRNATVTCIEPCALLVLDRQSFYQVMAHDFAVGSRLEKVALARSQPTGMN